MRGRLLFTAIAVLLGMLVALGFAGFAADAKAAVTSCQDPSAYRVPPGDDVYVVREGDTGWALAELYHEDPVKYGMIVKDNPKLDESWRWPKGRDRAGSVVLILCPGEPLVGMRKAGVHPSVLRPDSSFARAKYGIQGADLRREAEMYRAAQARLENMAVFLPFLLLLLLLLAAAYLAWLGPRSVTVQATSQAPYVPAGPDPLTAPIVPAGTPMAAAGPPIVEGGIHTDRQADVVARFERMAEARLAEMDPTGRYGGVRPRTARVESGRVSSRGPEPARYRDGWRRGVLQNERGYRGYIEYPGQEAPVEEIFLEGCGNDMLRHGGGLDRDTIEFTPDAVVYQAAPPTPPAPAVQPVISPSTMRAEIPVRLWTVVRRNVDNELRTEIALGAEEPSGVDIVAVHAAEFNASAVLHLTETGRPVATVVFPTVAERAAQVPAAAPEPAPQSAETAAGAERPVRPRRSRPASAPGGSPIH